MNIIRTDRLSAGQTEQIKKLLHECRACNGSSPFFPFEDGDLFYLLFTERERNSAGTKAREPAEETRQQICRHSDSLVLTCAAALSFFEEADGSCAECTAFTRPALRRKGYFSLLFDELSLEIEEIDLYFPVSDPEPGVLAALASLEAVHDRDEYRMELELEEAEACSEVSFHPVSSPDPAGNPSIRLRAQWEAMENDCFLLSFYQGEKAIGTCCLSFFGDSACFYSFEIKEALRGQGLGREALSLTLSLLRKGLPRPGCRRLSLHVSGLNGPAVSLYRKAGFQIKECLSYYLY